MNSNNKMLITYGFFVNNCKKNNSLTVKIFSATNQLSKMFCYTDDSEFCSFFQNKMRRMVYKQGRFCIREKG